MNYLKKTILITFFFSFVSLCDCGIDSALAEEIIETAVSSPASSISSSLSPEPTENGNKALEVLKERSEKIQDNFKKSEIDKKSENAQSDLESVQLEKKTLENINSEISDEVKKLQEQIAEQEILQGELQLAEQKNLENTQKLKDLELSKNSLQKDLEIKNLLLEKNKSDLEKLSQEEALKEYALSQNLALQKALQEKSNEELEQKFYVFLWVSLFFFILYLSRLFLSKKICNTRALKKKYGHRFVAFDIIGFLSYLGFVIWFVFYLKPEMVVYLLFLVGAIVMVLQEYIFSIFSSLFIVQGYKVGDRVRFDGSEGIIDNITLLKVFIRTIDIQGINIEELRTIPNSQFMKKEVIILPKSNIEKTSFKIILPNDLSVDQPLFIQHIEKNILQTNITVKSFNEITETEYFYEIDFSFMRTGQPVIELFWKETREKSLRIKRKILAELENFKKKSTPLKTFTEEIE